MHRRRRAYHRPSGRPPRAGLPQRRAELEELGIKYSEEDLVSYALFPQVALEFFERRDRAERPKEESAALAAALADILGVQEEALKESQAVPCGPPPWSAAARRELTTGRALTWRY